MPNRTSSEANFRMLLGHAKARRALSSARGMPIRDYTLSRQISAAACVLSAGRPRLFFSGNRLFRHFTDGGESVESRGRAFFFPRNAESIIRINNKYRL